MFRGTDTRDMDWLQVIHAVNEARPDTKATRPVRKRAMSAMPDRPIPDVRVITLRRYREDSDHEVDPEARGREYSHRFIVNAFWRRQWYPSEQRHKPKWIAPYVKGPKNKPLIIKDTAYLWRR